MKAITYFDYYADDTICAELVRMQQMLENNNMEAYQHKICLLLSTQVILNMQTENSVIKCSHSKSLFGIKFDNK